MMEEGEDIGQMKDDFLAFDLRNWWVSVQFIGKGHTEWCEFCFDVEILWDIHCPGCRVWSCDPDKKTAGVQT